MTRLLLVAAVACSGVAMSLVAERVLTSWHVSAPTSRLPKSISRLLDPFTNKGERDVIPSQVPDMIDVVALAVQGGSSFERALERFVSAYPERELAHEMQHALRSFRFGLASREEALDALVESTQDDALARFRDVVVRSLRTGSPLADDLTRLASDVRRARISRIEARIERAPVKMVIPTTGLVLPALLLTILGPFFSSYV